MVESSFGKGGQQLNGESQTQLFIFRAQAKSFSLSLLSFMEFPKSKPCSIQNKKQTKNPQNPNLFFICTHYNLNSFEYPSKWHDFANMTWAFSGIIV